MCAPDLLVLLIVPVSGSRKLAVAVSKHALIGRPHEVGIGVSIRGAILRWDNPVEEEQQFFWNNNEGSHSWSGNFFFSLCDCPSHSPMRA